MNTEDINLPASSKINSFLLKNNHNDVIKALDFFATEGKLLYIHGFLGTGKRQFINYISTFVNKDVIKLEYYCKASTVCDDILLSFIDILEKNSLTQAVIHTAKITTLSVKLQQYISSIKKPFVIIIHSFDSIEETNRTLVKDTLVSLAANDNVKLVVSTRAMIQDVLGDLKVDRKIFLKAFSKEIFIDFVKTYNVNGTEDAIIDFYKYSRGYYYYTELAIKIIQSMNITLNEFLSKYTMSGMSFDSFLGMTYVNLIPNTIRNFFWFLRTIRHGISLNALAILELYDDFSIGYLKNNLMIYQSNEILYVQDYFQQDIDISIPAKTEIRLHKYIIGIYEKELKEQVQSRTILISRQALRNEIEYHKNKIYELENNKTSDKTLSKNVEAVAQADEQKMVLSEEENDINNRRERAKALTEEKKYTEAIEEYQKILEEYDANLDAITEVRIDLARLYYTIKDYEKSQHYYELAESYYKKKDENINLNYLYYELTSLYFDMYKIERAKETIKKVIYSVDTPQSLLIDACTLLGNIYSDTDKPKEAYKYYIKAIESFDENTPNEKKAELYFKRALVCDEDGNEDEALEYYLKCEEVGEGSPYLVLAYSNMGAIYFERGKSFDAEKYFMRVYRNEKKNNNYEGLYFAASYIAKIYVQRKVNIALDFLSEAKTIADFINNDYYSLEAAIALGDYYYNNKNYLKEALHEYMCAQKIAQKCGNIVDIEKINERINDVKLRIESQQN